MNFNFNPSWKESLILLAGMLLLVVLYYLWNKKSINEEALAKKRALAHLEAQQQAPATPTSSKLSPQIVQAHERFMILLDRRDLHKLVQRVPPISDKKADYVDFLLQNIEQEFDFNVTQQLYVSEETWALIQMAKHYVIQLILKTSVDTSLLAAKDLQQQLKQLPVPADSVLQMAKNKLRTELHTLA